MEWQLIDKVTKTPTKKVLNVEHFRHSLKTPECQAILARIHSDQHILCSCNNNALMFVRHAYDVYTLVNHPVLGSHEISCPFHSLISGQINRPGHDANSEPWNEMSTFCAHNRDGALNLKQVEHLLYYLIFKSYSNFTSSKRNTKQLARLLKLHEPSRAIAFGETNLGEYLFYGSRGHEFARSKLRRSKDSWKGPGVPHTVVIDVLPSRTKINTKHCVIEAGGLTHHYKKMKGKIIEGLPHLTFSTLTYDDPTATETLNSCVLVPIATEVDFLPSSHTITTHFVTKLKKHYLKSAFDWLIISPLKHDPDVDEITASPLPELIIQAKNESGRIVLRDVINVREVDTNKQRDAYHAKRVMTVSNHEELDYYMRTLIQ